MSSAGGVGGYGVAEVALPKERQSVRRALVTPSVLSIACRKPLECDRAAVAETLRTRRGGMASLAWSLAFPNQMALNSALTVRPLALNVALGLIACPLMKVHGVAAKPRHPNSFLA